MNVQLSRDERKKGCKLEIRITEKKKTITTDKMLAIKCKQTIYRMKRKILKKIFFTAFEIMKNQINKFLDTLHAQDGIIAHLVLL